MRPLFILTRFQTGAPDPAGEGMKRHGRVRRPSLPVWGRARHAPRPLSSSAAGDAPACARRLLSSVFGIMPAMPASVCWTCAASVVFRFRGTCPPCRASVCWTGAASVPSGFGGRTPHAPAPVVIQCGGLVSGSSGRALRPSLPRRGTRPPCPRARPGAKVLPSRGTR